MVALFFVVIVIVPLSDQRPLSALLNLTLTLYEVFGANPPIENVPLFPSLATESPASVQPPPLSEYCVQSLLGLQVHFTFIAFSELPLLYMLILLKYLGIVSSDQLPLPEQLTATV